MTEFDKNQEIAETICQDLKWNGQQFKYGDCVALLDGEVIAVAPDLEGAHDALRNVESDLDRGMIVPVGPLVPEVII